MNDLLLRRSTASRCLPYLLFQALISVSNTFVLVWVWRTQLPDVRSKLPHALPVSPSDDQVCLCLNAHGKPLGYGEFYGMRVPKIEHHLVTFHLRTVANSNNIQVFLEPCGDPSDRVSHQAPHEPVQC